MKSNYVICLVCNASKLIKGKQDKSGLVNLVMLSNVADEADVNGGLAFPSFCSCCVCTIYYQQVVGRSPDVFPGEFELCLRSDHNFYFEIFLGVIYLVFVFSWEVPLN